MGLMHARICTDSHLEQLRNNGCVKVKVTDPRQLSREKLRCMKLALRLGNRISSSYHYPWLYVLLGEKLPMSRAVLSAEKTLRRSTMRSVLSWMGVDARTAPCDQPAQDALTDNPLRT